MYQVIRFVSKDFSFSFFVFLGTVQVVFWSVEWWVKPISTSTCPEFLVEIKELTTLTCCGAFPTEFVGFHRGESHHSVTVRLSLTYRWILVVLISSQKVNQKPNWAFQECSEQVECNVKGQKESWSLSKTLRGNHFFSSFKITMSLVHLDSYTRLGFVPHKQSECAWGPPM